MILIMCERKTRARKTISYSKLSGEAESDDDFQAFSPPNNVKKTKEKKDPQGKAFVEEVSKKRTNVSERVFERNLRKTLAKSKETVIHGDSDDEADFQPSSKYKKIAADSSIDEKQSSKTLSTATTEIITNNLIDTKSNVDEPIKVENSTEGGKKIEEKLPDADKIKKYLCDLENFKKREVQVKVNLTHSDNDKNEDELKDSSSEYEEPKSQKPKIAQKTDKPNFTNIKSSRKPDLGKSIHISPKVSPSITPKQKAKVTSNNSPSDLLQHVKPVNLPSVGLRVGLSRKRSSKPLHPNSKPVES